MIEEHRRMHEDAKDKKLVNLGQLFRPIIILGKITSLFSGYSEGRGIGNRICRFVRNIYFVLTQLLIWSMTMKYGFVLFRENDEGRIIPLLAVFTFNLGGSYFSFRAFRCFCKKFEDIDKLFFKHQKKFGVVEIHKRTEFLFKFNAVLSAISCIVNAFWMCYMYYGFGRNDLQRLNYPLTFDTPMSAGISLTLLFLFQLYVGAHLWNMAYASYGMFYIVYATFNSVIKNIQNGVNKITGDSDTLVENVIESLRQEHTSAVQILEDTNSMLSHYIFSIYVTCLPIVVFALYGIIRRLLTQYETFLVLSISFFFFHQVLIFTVAASIITLKAHSPLDTLLTIDVRLLTDQSFKSMMLFIERLKGSVIGFRVYELFTLDTSAILTLIGTLVTYTVVMLQFASVSTSSNLESNSTNITLL